MLLFKEKGFAVNCQKMTIMYYSEVFSWNFQNKH